MNNLEERIEAFRLHCVDVLTKEWQRAGYQHPMGSFVVQYRRGWAIVWKTREENGEHESSYAFICLADSDKNKTLGPVKAGDIHRPATFRAPAKHSRGSVFSTDFDNCAGPYGIKYLS